MNPMRVLTPTPLILLLATALVFQAGCAGPAASKTVKGAGIGGTVGALGAAATGQDLGGIAAVGAAGAAIGAAIGAVQERRENKRQDTLAQQRAYNQAIAMQKRAIEKEKADLQEELAIAEGFRITQEELDEMNLRAETAESRLKALQAKRDEALGRKKSLDELEQREKDAQAEAARLEKELADLEAGTFSGTSDTSESVELPNL